MVMMLMLQGAQQAARYRYWAGMRFVWLLLVVMLILGIAVLVKKLMR
jgi:hypothetical protein